MTQTNNNNKITEFGGFEAVPGSCFGPLRRRTAPESLQIRVRKQTLQIS